MSSPYRSLLLEAYEWFDEHIGHDGAPDGGDPAWVGSVRDAIGGEKSTYGPDFDPILTSELRERAAARRRVQDLETALHYLDCALSNDWNTSEGETEDDAVRFYDCLLYTSPSPRDRS